MSNHLYKIIATLGYKAIRGHNDCNKAEDLNDCNFYSYNTSEHESM